MPKRGIIRARAVINECRAIKCALSGFAINQLIFNTKQQAEGGAGSAEPILLPLQRLAQSFSLS
ncbi:hypothetical protein BV914_11000 [Neisseria dumasiana]|nr:hypothetical protein BV914_11000 [Neisseria dumasiana]